MSITIVDSGPLVAALNVRDAHHRWACEVLATLRPPLHTCEAVLGEVAFLLRSVRAGPRQVLSLVQGELLTIPFRVEAECEAIGRLLDRYASVPMSLADACLVRMSELASRSVIVTLDSDFRIYRRLGRHGIALIIPE